MAVIIDDRCTGCGACAAVCPVNCITMRDNAEGFTYPRIDRASCINCNRCVSACPLNSKETSSPTMSCLFCTSNRKTLSRCASGGAFTELAASFIEEGGVVVGVADDIRQGSRFSMAADASALQELSGSKYYQCNLEPETIVSIGSMLGAGQAVLFCGTPCQVQAVKGAIPRSLRTSLFLVDIICQGVPSRISVDAYRRQASLRKGSEIAEHLFRAKLKGHEGQYVTQLTYANGDSETKVGAEDLYARSFMYQVSLRESCYECPFALMARVGDLTLGDHWAPGLNASFERGSTSLILVNSDKGKRMVAALEGRGILRNANIEDATRSNIPLHHPVKRPLSRSIFYKAMKIFGFAAAVRICCWRFPIKRLIACIHK